MNGFVALAVRLATVLQCEYSQSNKLTMGANIPLGLLPSQGFFAKELLGQELCCLLAQ